MEQLLRQNDSSHSDFLGLWAHFLTHRWEPYVQIKLIWMEYFKLKVY